MKKAACTTFVTFVNLMNTIHEKEITTKAALMADPPLYTEFWLALKSFCRLALLSKTSGKNAQGEPLPGNAVKIDVLEARGAAARDELETDCAIRIIEKLDLVLRQPLETQKNYCHKICNNLVNDYFRRMPREMTFVPLNGTVVGTDADHSYTYEDVIGDDTYDPERMRVQRETLMELRKKLKDKQASARAEKREAILNEAARLSKRPAEVLCRLGVTHLGIKPRDLAARIIREGCDSTFAKILFAAAKQNGIELSQIRSIIADHRPTEKSLKADTNSAEQVAGQISRLVYRANKHLSK